jgi:anti-sigma factor RsiW
MPDGVGTEGTPGTDDHDAFEADFSDYFEKTLAPERTSALEAHLEACVRCRAEYDRFRETMGILSGLHKVPAPARFEREVEATIHRRSAGRFFGRKAFGDRVPFELLAAIGLLLIVAVVLLLRWSSTGAIHEPLSPSPPADTKPDIRKTLPTP